MVGFFIAQLLLRSELRTVNIVWQPKRITEQGFPLPNKNRAGPWDAVAGQLRCSCCYFAML